MGCVLRVSAAGSEALRGLRAVSRWVLATGPMLLTATFTIPVTGYELRVTHCGCRPTNRCHLRRKTHNTY